MRLHYYAETDSLYIEFNPAPSIETREVAEGVNIDLDGQGGVIGIDIDQASKKLDLSTLETSALPLKATRAA